MTTTLVAVIAGLVFAWALASGVLERHDVTGAMVFTAAGYLISNPDWGWVPIDVHTATIHLIAEVTLALVLFTDASRVNLRQLRQSSSLPIRLLVIGLPLSVLLGSLAALWLLTDLPWALAGFLGAALAATDAALSMQVINDERIPERTRQALNVESGLNDGLATPIVTVMLAIAASQLGLVTESESYEAGSALRELGAGVVVGLVVGAAGAMLITWTAKHASLKVGARLIAVLAVAIAALALALAVHGNGFISAFVAGVVFGSLLDKEANDLDRMDELPELGGTMLGLVVWFLFGAVLVPLAFEHLDASLVAYAIVSLTVVRVLPVAVCTIGTAIERPGILFIGWVGPRGLASVVFATLAIEALGEASQLADRAVAAVALTVLFSVVLHGITAGPGGRRYVRASQARTHQPPRRPSAAADGL